jgi:uncharacterized membrane protein YhiD involved in acid resistance
MKTMNKVIAAMMMMAITTAMPAMAGNKNHNDKKDKVVVVNNGKKESHFDKVDKKTTVSTSRLTHFDAHKKNAYRPDMKTYTFKVSRHDSHKKVVAKVENVKGVKEAKWNPCTREVTVVYDANVTSVRNIKHFMA